MCPLSGTSAGGSPRVASRRIFKGGDIVLVDSAAMLVSGAAMVLLGDSSGEYNVCSSVPADEGVAGSLGADGRCKSANPRAGGASKHSARVGTSRASVLCNPSAGGYMFKECKLRRCHIGTALRNIKRRTLKLASVRRDIHRHDYGFYLASGFASSWVNTSVDIDAG